MIWLSNKPTERRPFEIIDWAGGERRPILQLLAFLPKLYPEGGSWLERRLSDVERGVGNCLLLRRHGQVHGILIETDKGRRRRKISTLYLSPAARGIGLGSQMLRMRRVEWIRYQVETAYITVASERLAALQPTLEANGFSKLITCPSRYGSLRDEVIFQATVSH